MFPTEHGSSTQLGATTSRLGRHASEAGTPMGEDERRPIERRISMLKRGVRRRRDVLDFCIDDGVVEKVRAQAPFTRPTALVRCSAGCAVALRLAIHSWML